MGCSASINVLFNKELGAKLNDIDNRYGDADWNEGGVSGSFFTRQNKRIKPLESRLLTLKQP